MVQIFLEGTPGRLVALQQAVTERNAEALERAAHSLKGELGYLGISVLSQKARELEEMGRSRDILRASAVLAEFEAGINAVLEQMRAMQPAKAGLGVAVQSAGAGQ